MKKFLLGLAVVTMFASSSFALDIPVHVNLSYPATKLEGWSYGQTENVVNGVTDDSVVLVLRFIPKQY